MPTIRRFPRLVIAFFASVVPILAVLAITSPSLSAPEPDAVPSRWEFNVQPGPLKAISVRIPGKGRRAFFYWTYKVTNNTGEDRPLTPAFELFTQDGTKGETRRSGRNVPREATEQIMNKIANPLLLDEVEIQTGLLLQGPENAREGLVVWPAERLKVDDVVIFAKGFSGETKSVTRPDTGERRVLRKTLMLRHQVDGTLDPTSTRPLNRTVERWILR